jgi:hypothetical protein
MTAEGTVGATTCSSSFARHDDHLEGGILHDRTDRIAHVRGHLSLAPGPILMLRPLVLV